jgi:phosphatidylglycerol:prolipoprotein diacylglycerol transferase
MNLRYFILNPISIYQLWNGGLIYYGGLISSIMLCVIYSYKHNISILQLGDFLVPGLSLGHSIGRVGCLFSGCCYGKPSNVPWSIIFNNTNSFAMTGKHLHPTQIYEAVMNLCIFVILHFYSKQHCKSGTVFSIYLVLYGIGRFIIEFFRCDFRISFVNLSIAQIISIFILIFGILIICKRQ